MYHKVRNTLVAVAVAMAMLGAGYGVGSPPSDYDGTGLGIVAANAVAADALDPLARKRILGVRRHMAMPFFSFAPLLPRQGG
jgi:hypothetical protein